MSDLIIRPETAADRPIIRDLIVEVFTEAFGSGEGEATLVETLRGEKDFHPSLSLVATLDDRIVGHIFFCSARFESYPQLSIAVLAPMSVRREHQRQGIGSRLAREGLGNCSRRGYEAVFTTGDPNYYSRFGFEPLAAKGITTPFRTEYDMALELVAGVLSKVRGELQYPPAYNAFL